jgi:hypothetical protein
MHSGTSGGVFLHMPSSIETPNIQLLLVILYVGVNDYSHE